MRRAAAILLVLVLGLGQPVWAGPIGDSVKKEAAQLIKQRSTVSRFSTNGFFWTGVVAGGIGATLAVLAATVSKSNTPESAACEALRLTGCSGYKTTNKGLLWSGIALVGAGVGLVAIGAANSSIQLGPGHLGVTHKVTF